MDSAKKQRPRDDAVKAAGELAVLPGFQRMGITQLVQPNIRLAHVLRDPSAVLIQAGLRAAVDDFAESAVKGEVEDFFIQDFFQTARNMNLGREKDKTRIGRPPQDRFAIRSTRERCRGRRRAAAAAATGRRPRPAGRRARPIPPAENRLWRSAEKRHRDNFSLFGSMGLF